MKNKFKILFSLFLMWLLLPGQLQAQAWNLVKEKDGVKLYSRQEPGKNLQSFRGVAEIKAPAEKVFALIEDVNHREWWDKNLEQIRLLKYEKNKRAQYYLVYKMPWPFTNRDMCADVTVTISQINGEYRVTAVPLRNACPENKDLERIKDYKQVWTVRPVNQNLAQVELEFYVDPTVKLPDWLLNRIFIDSPIISIKALRQQIEKNEASVLPSGL